MPWKMISFIIVLVLAACFIGFNLENKCDISFGFKVLKDVPVFMTAFLSLALGVLIMLPFSFGHNKKTKEPKQKKSEMPPANITPTTPENMQDGPKINL